MKFWKLLFYIQRVLFPPKVDVLDEPSKEVQLVQLKKKKENELIQNALNIHFILRKKWFIVEWDLNWESDPPKLVIQT